MIRLECSLGGSISECKMFQRTRIRTDAMCCFDDDKGLEAYFESKLPGLQKRLDHWYRNDLRMREDPFSRSATSDAVSGPSTVTSMPLVSIHNTPKARPGKRR
jgi:hypothetical protein